MTMKRNVNQFRERFNRWKSGELVYSSGRPVNKISDEQYANIMERVASENNPIWNERRKKEGLPELSVDEDLLRILNDNSYDYRGYYNKYPNGTGNAIDHWTDEFKTVYHPTFSNESRYAPNNIHYVGKTQFNPKELKGGSWGKDGEFRPSLDQKLHPWKKFDGGKSEDSPLVKLLYNNDANAWYMNDPYMRELAFKDVVKKTIDSYPSPYQPPTVRYDSDLPTTHSKFTVDPDGWSLITLGTATLKNDAKNYYNFKGNPLRTAAHEVAHYYDNLTERQFRTDDDSNSNFKFPKYNLDKLLDSPTGLYSVLMHDMKPSERYADRIAAEIVPGYDRYENTKRKYNNGKSSLRIPKFEDGKTAYQLATEGVGDYSPTYNPVFDTYGLNHGNTGVPIPEVTITPNQILTDMYNGQRSYNPSLALALRNKPLLNIYPEFDALMLGRNLVTDGTVGALKQVADKVKKKFIRPPKMNFDISSNIDPEEFELAFVNNIDISLLKTLEDFKKLSDYQFLKIFGSDKQTITKDLLDKLNRNVTAIERSGWGYTKDNPFTFGIDAISKDDFMKKRMLNYMEPYIKKITDAKSAMLAKHDSKTLYELYFKRFKHPERYPNEESPNPNTILDLMTLRNHYGSPLYKKQLIDYYSKQGYSNTAAEHAADNTINDLLYNLMTAKYAEFPDDYLLSNRHGFLLNHSKRADGIYSSLDHTISVKNSASKTGTPFHEMVHASDKGTPFLDNSKHAMRVRNGITGDKKDYYENIVEQRPRVLAALDFLKHHGINYTKASDDDIMMTLILKGGAVNADINSLINNYILEDIPKAVKGFKSLIPIGIATGATIHTTKSKNE